MSSAKQIQLPAAVARFVEQQETMPVDRLYEEPLPPRVPYAEYWRRAVACMLLSGRVRPKADGNPNRTDLIGMCKEANFDQYLFDKVAGFLVGAHIIAPTSCESRQYEPGNALRTFWNHEMMGLSVAARHAFIYHLADFTGSKIQRPTPVYDAALDDFVAVFASAFRGLALPRDAAGNVLSAFSRLSKPNLQCLCKQLALDVDTLKVMNWSEWLDAKGQAAIMSALYACEWAYVAEHRGKNWFYVSDIARVMLGVERPPKIDPLPTDLKVLPDLSVFAGSGLPFDRLIPFFRACRIKRIDRIFEFRIDPKRLREQATKASAAEDIRVALAPAGKLPETVEALLSGNPPARGRIGFQGCSAIVKPENAEVLNAIREHRRLKVYIEAGAPPGYLLIKYKSNPVNFIKRCRELGFTVEAL